MLGKQLQTAAAGNAGGDVLGVEDVFSTWLYDGNNSTQTITNGIDLAGEGGLVWLKKRSAIASPFLFDTVRGAEKYLQTNYSGGESTANTTLSAFNSDGFTLKTEGDVNGSGATFASWTFRKAPGFFDVVTWTGDGSGTRNISHSLGAVPGVMIWKKTSTTSDWVVYHRSLGTSSNLYLNTTSGSVGTSLWGTGPTSTNFPAHTAFNVSGETYVAYLFAHDAGGFGDDGTESVIKCGSFTTNGSNQDINLGWEAQWLLVKSASDTAAWWLVDTMRGMPGDLSGSNMAYLYANQSNAEALTSQLFAPYSQGFQVKSSLAISGKNYIYIAIRRGPMKTPTDATDVFDLTSFTGNSNANIITSNVDMKGGAGRLYWSKIISGSSSGTGYCIADDLRGNGRYLDSTVTSAETTSGNFDWGVQNFIKHNNWFYNSSSSTYIAWMFRRAPGFFDVVAYTGTGSTLNVNHNLGVAPELIITKNRNSAITNWAAYSATIGNTQGLYPNAPNAASTLSWWNNTSPTSTVFTVVGTDITVNQSGSGHIAYLFATCPGVSKVGSYTGTASTLNIDCGFSAGARFVLIKRTDNIGDWYVWDTTRGITAGTDSYLLLNSASPPVTSTDYIDPYSAGFTVTSSAPAAINASGGTYLFLAIA